MKVFAVLQYLAVLPLVSSWLAQWEQLDAPHRIAPKRSGHASFGILDQHYVFGGYVEEDGPKRYVVNDLWNWNGNTWKQIEQAGDVPGPRLVSAAAVLDDKAYLFAGWDPQTEGTGGIILDDVCELDLKTHVWKKIAGFPDGPCSRHVAVTLGDKILIHNHRCLDFVYLFDPITQSFRKQSTSGTCPSSRGLHAAVAVNDSTLVFVGGAAQSGIMSRESFALDVNTWTWTSLADFPDTARAAPCLCKLNERSVIMYGGAERTDFGLNPRGDVWILNLDTNKWSLAIGEDASGAPPTRNAASLARVGESAFLLTGAWSPFKETSDDCYILKFTE